MKNLIILGDIPLADVAIEYAKLCNKWESVRAISFEKDGNGEDIDSYKPKENDEFVTSFFDVSVREKAVTLMRARGAVFTNVIHPFSNIHSTAVLGVGNIIGAFTTVSTDSVIGNHVFIQDHCNIGHNCQIGDYCHIFVGCIISGINSIGSRSMLFTRSLVYPKVKTGVHCVVGAASVVVRKVKDGETVAGNPAKKIEI